MVVKCIQCKEEIEAHICDLQRFKYCPMCGKKWQYELICF